LVDLELRPSELSKHVAELTEAINVELIEKWRNTRGLQVVSIAMNPPSIPQDQADAIRRIQSLSNPTAAAATLVGAQAEAMKAAASNPNGAMMGFMGMGMAQQAGGMNPQNLYAMGAQQQAAAPAQPAPAQPAANSWKCACGNVAEGKFCMECGAKKPENDNWKCACGAISTGKFCPECGAKKPTGYRCNKCGWEPADPKNPPKFCPECGDPFNESDAK